MRKAFALVLTVLLFCTFMRACVNKEPLTLSTALKDFSTYDFSLRNTMNMLSDLANHDWGSARLLEEGLNFWNFGEFVINVLGDLIFGIADVVLTVGAFVVDLVADVIKVIMFVFSLFGIDYVIQLPTVPA